MSRHRKQEQTINYCSMVSQSCSPNETPCENRTYAVDHVSLAMVTREEVQDITGLIICFVVYIVREVNRYVSIYRKEQIIF